MNILAIEFSSNRRSVAFVNVDGPNGGEAATGDSEPGALGLVEEALRRAGVEREEIDVVAVGLGPGSFTGIRLAIAVGQGWQLGRGVHTVGVSSLDVMATLAHEQGRQGRILVAVDAQRGEYYVREYALGKPGWEAISPIRLAMRDEVERDSIGAAALLGPEIGGRFARGIDIFPTAEALGRLVAAGRGLVSTDPLEPIYLRETRFVKALPPRVPPTS